MTYEEFREQLDDWWQQTDAREVAAKNSQGALLDLMVLYERLDPQEQGLADQVLGEWIASPNQRKRFDALAMVDHFRIRSAVASLRSHAQEVEKRTDHEAPYELAKIARILSRLEDWPDGVGMPEPGNSSWTRADSGTAPIAERPRLAPEMEKPSNPGQHDQSCRRHDDLRRRCCSGRTGRRGQLLSDCRPVVIGTQTKRQCRGRSARQLRVATLPHASRLDHGHAVPQRLQVEPRESVPEELHELGRPHP
jgi:hypothetical protein